MIINTRFICREIVGDIPNGQYELPDDISVSDALAEFSKNGGFIENYLDYMLIMINSKPASAQSPLHDGDSLMLLRKAMGG